jgi:methyl-accepting chemotaxis protein
MTTFPEAQVWKPVFIEAQARVQDAAVGDWVSWQSQVSPITVIAIIGMIVGFGGWLLRIGGKNRDFESVQDSVKDIKKEFKDLVTERDKSRESMRNERDAFQAAMNASLTMMESRNAEFRGSVAHSYATKAELTSLEERTSKDMDRIVSRLDQISGRLETIGDSVVKALGSLKH